MMSKIICERDIERYLVRRVKAAGGEVRKVKWIGRSGAPDRVVMRDNNTSHALPTVWVELKAPGKKATGAQKREHALMRDKGQHVAVIDSFEDVDWLLS